MIDTIVLFVVQSLATYGINKQLDKRFSGPDFEKRLRKIIDNTISEYESKFNIEEEGIRFPFYHSQVIIDELLKYRLFCSKGHKLDIERIQNALATNANIIPPAPSEIQEFMELFDQNVKEDDLICELEANENYKYEIFNISFKIDHLTDLVEKKLNYINNYTKGNYYRELEECRRNIYEFKPKTVISWLGPLKSEFYDKPEASKLLADLYDIEAQCFELIGKSEEAWKQYIAAYKCNPENFKYKEKAAFAYFYLNDPKAKQLSDELLAKEDYNVYAWFIRTTLSKDILEFIDNVPKTVLSSMHYQRLLYSWLRINNNIKIVVELQKRNILIKPDYQSIAESVAYQNFFHWIFILSITLNDYFFDKPIYFRKESNLKSQTEYLFRLLSILSEVIIGTELEDEYPAIIFYYRWFKLQLINEASDVDEMILAYKKLDNKDSLINLIYANILQQYGRVEEAIIALEEDSTNVDHNILLLKCHCYLKLEDLENFKTTFFQYVELVEEIDSLTVLNILNFLQILSSSQSEIRVIEEDLKGKRYSDSSFMQFISIYLNSLSDVDHVKDMLEEIESIKHNIHENYLPLRKFIAQMFINLGEFEIAYTYLKNWVDKTEVSQELHQYIEVLILSKKDQTELLNLLQYWRLNFTPLDDFYRKEIELRQAISDWKTIEIIAKKGFEIFSDKQIYLYILIIAFEFNEKKNEILELIPEIKKYDFTEDSKGLNIASILIRAGEFEYGLDLFYQLASDKKNIAARNGFISLSLHVPEGLFKSFDEIGIGCYVKYEHIGNTFIIEITETFLSANPQYQQLLGKKVGDEIKLIKRFSAETDSIRITRIMNKYLALHDQILLNINDPLGSSAFEVVEFPSELDKDTLKRIMVKKFGVIGTQQKDQQEKNFSKYYNYEISLGELTSFNFDRDYIKSFFSLTLPPTEGYLVTPINYYKEISNINDKEFILDVPSSLILYMFSKQFNLELKRKIIISNGYIQFLKNYIQREIHLPESEFSFSVTLDGLQSQFYQKGHKEKKISFLKDFLKWLQDNTEERIPEKKLDLIMQLEFNNQPDEFLTLILDNHILALEENCILVTDDSFYFRKINTLSGSIISTEIFLKHLFPDNSKDILLYLSQRYFIGITPSREVLIEAFNERFNTSKGYIFNNIIRSMSIGEKKSKYLFNEALEFIKHISISSVLPVPEYEVVITNIFVNLLRGVLSVNTTQFLFQTIQIKFQLLPEQRMKVIKCLTSAVDILVRV